uniref:non-specific serine/threonine protein kinase n=2 Tax=Schistocephalus solidus TaxID=70667 RepID=A0A0X3P203_SCHSO
MDPVEDTSDDLFASHRSLSTNLCSKLSSFWNSSSTRSPISSRTRSKMRSRPGSLMNSTRFTFPNFSSYERHQLVTTGDDTDSLPSQKPTSSLMEQSSKKLERLDEDSPLRVSTEKSLPVVFSTPGPSFEPLTRSEVLLNGVQFTPIPFTDLTNSYGEVASQTASVCLSSRSSASPKSMASHTGDQQTALSPPENKSLTNTSPSPASVSPLNTAPTATALGKKSDARMKRRLTRQFRPSLPSLSESYIRVYKVGDALQILLKLAEQTDIGSFEHVFPRTRRGNVRKVGEGTFSEVFICADEDRVLKLIPVGGTCNFNGEKQKDFSEVVSEVIIAKQVSSLASGTSNNTKNFVQLKCIRVVKGAVPAYLVRAWEEFKKNHGSENDHPRIFPRKQQWIVLESTVCGQPLENAMPACSLARLSVFCQTALGLAVAEQRLAFEHRDLHWGNVLIADSPSSPAATSTCPYSSSSCPRLPVSRLLDVEYQPPPGPLTNIIDFTLSRMNHADAPLFIDLSRDEELFTGVGDHQFDIYREMRKELGDDWSLFRPKTNVFWLHYLAEKLKSTASLHCSPREKQHRESRLLIGRLEGQLRQPNVYASASDFVCKHSFFASLRRTTLLDDPSDKFAEISLES